MLTTFSSKGEKEMISNATCPYLLCTLPGRALMNNVFFFKNLKKTKEA